MLQKTQGIVLHSLKYKDTSIIVDIYTEVSGRASFLVPVSRSRKAAVKSVLFQPLSLVELEADFRPNTAIYKVKEAATKKGAFRNERLPKRKAGIDQFSQIEMTKYRRRKRA